MPPSREHWHFVQDPTSGERRIECKICAKRVAFCKGSYVTIDRHLRAIHGISTAPGSPQQPTAVRPKKKKPPINNNYSMADQNAPQGAAVSTMRLPEGLFKMDENDSPASPVICLMEQLLGSFAANSASNTAALEEPEVDVKNEAPPDCELMIAEDEQQNFQQAILERLDRIVQSQEKLVVAITLLTARFPPSSA